MTMQTLTDALAELGITHRKGRTEGHQELFAEDGSSLGEYRSADAWALVHLARPQSKAMQAGLSAVAAMDAAGRA